MGQKQREQLEREWHVTSPAHHRRARARERERGLDAPFTHCCLDSFSHSSLNFPSTTNNHIPLLSSNFIHEVRLHCLPACLPAISPLSLSVVISSARLLSRVGVRWLMRNGYIDPAACSHDEKTPNPYLEITTADQGLTTHHAWFLASYRPCGLEGAHRAP